jgi:signal transduction histidine kinase
MQPELQSLARRHDILLVEDNPGDAALVHERFSDIASLTFNIQHVQCLADAMKAVREAPPDVIILDLNLPDSQSTDTLVTMKGLAADVPVVVVSGHVDQRLREVVLAHGAADVFTKDEANSRYFPLTVLSVVERTRMHAQHRQLDLLLDATPDAIVVVDTAGVVQYVNDAALHLFGRSRSDFVGTPFQFPITSTDPQEITVPGPGDERACEMRVVPFEWHQKKALLASLRDITKQKKLELQLVMSDRLVSLGTLAAGVAHEINNPLAAVYTNLECAIDTLRSSDAVGPTRAETLSTLADALAAAAQIRRIVRDVKLFSRADDGTRGAFDLHRMLDSVIRMVRGRIEERAVLVKSYGATCRVYGNESRLSQVFLNLLVNAAEAIPLGDPSHNQIRLVTRMCPDHRVAIDVEDTGTGIPPDVQRRLFTPFFTTKPVGSGTGLGLAICQRVVASEGGEIVVRTECGSGTRFSVHLSAAVDYANVSTTGAPPLAAPTTNRGSVLIIDDEPAVASALERLLKRQHDVKCVDRAADALQLIERGQRFDAILCDLRMPGMNGPAFCAALEVLNPAQARQVIVMTGGVLATESTAFLDRAIYPRLDKPFDMTRLHELLTRVMKEAT